MHRDPCKYGADIGLTLRTQGWLTETGTGQRPEYADWREAHLGTELALEASLGLSPRLTARGR